MIQALNRDLGTHPALFADLVSISACMPELTELY